jgi:hypothetical protein
MLLNIEGRRPLFLDKQELTMTAAKARLSAQGRTQLEAGTFDASRNSLPAGPGAEKGDSKFRNFAVVCAWAVVGTMLTVALIWLGLEIQ